jgi:hypothetical protein
MINTKIRNWQKLRLLGFNLNESVLTETEKRLYYEAMANLNKIKDLWDSNTEDLLGHSLKPYKCFWCNKRSNKSYILEQDGRNYCKKHYELLKE